MSLSQSGIDAMFETAGGSPAAVAAARESAASPSASLKGEAAPPRASQAPPSQQDIPRILGLSVPLSVTVAERQMMVESILRINVGTIIEFDVSFDAELTLTIGHRIIGRGQAVKVGENFGLRLTRIDPIPDRIDALGGHR